MPIQSYRDFECYKNALVAIPPTSKALEQFPVHKAARLIEQIRSAAHSVPSNIAEGYGRKQNEDDFKRFLRIAMGSGNEVIARLETAMAEGYIDAQTFEKLVIQWTVVGKQLNKLIQNWRTYPSQKDS